ncbi:MAG: SpoIIE family protein phosphatase [Candidatus Riflebacteria bacterium]|nr:SpoIIE family protein phosphatase [Candidatus Riflebacteria bacterium]
MADPRPVATWQGAMWTVLLFLLVWVPLQALFLYGLDLSQESVLEAAAALRQRDLSWTLLRFRFLLQPEEILTRRWRAALRTVDTRGTASPPAAASTPDDWRLEVTSALADLPPEAYDLLVTDGKAILPAAPGYDPSLLGGFLATCTMRADSTRSVADMFAAMVRMRRDFDYMGSERFSTFRWIPLPTFPGLANRIFDRVWTADTVVFGANTPRHSWAAFGHVRGCPGWRYLLTFHRQHLPDDLLRRLSLAEARREGLDVAWRPPGEGAGGVAGELSRQGRDLLLTDFDERIGHLEARTRLPLGLWTVYGLAWVVNLSFSLAAWLVVWRQGRGGTAASVPVARQLALGILLGAGFSLLISLVVAQGMLGTKVFRDLQTSLVEAEREMRGLEEDYNRYLDTVSTEYRALVRQLPWPWDPRRGVPIIERLSGLHQVALLHLMKENGDRLLTRGPYSWGAYHLSRKPARERDAFLLERIPRGAYLLEHELEMLADADDPARGDVEVRRRLFREGRKSNKFLNPKLFAIVSRMVCQAFNRGSAITPQDIEESKGGVLLNLVLQGREIEVLNDILGRMGTLAPFKMASFEGLAFIDIVKDATGSGRMAALLFHRVTNLGDQFLRQRYLKGRGQKRFPQGAVAFESLKDDHGMILDPALATVLRRTFTEVERQVAFLPATGSGPRSLFLARCSSRLPSHVLFVTLPLERLTAGALQLGRWIGAGFLLLLALAAGTTVALRRVFLAPLADLQRSVGAIGRGEVAAPRVTPAFGELGALADLFNQTLDRLRQMNIARTVQENLLPTEGLQVGTFALRGQSVMMSQVGGDYFDLLPAGPDRVLVVVGDVAGHGLPAAIVMAMLKSGLMVLAAEPIGIDEVARRMNETLLRLLSRTKMMTAFLGFLKPSTGAFSFTNAGHNYPLLISARAGSRYLKQINLPLGSLKNRTYRKDDLTLEPGDTLIICTDGILEAADPAGNLLGYEGFQRWFPASPGNDPGTVLAAVLERIAQYTGQGAPQDDVTILVVCRQTTPAAPLPPPPLVPAPSGPS